MQDIRYFDNNFTSTPLLDPLADLNICSMGAFQESRIASCPFPDKKKGNKRTSGTYELMSGKSVQQSFYSSLKFFPK